MQPPLGLDIRDMLSGLSIVQCLRRLYPLPALLLCALLPALAHADSRPIRLATATSTDNSGLLDVVLPLFEAQSGYQVEVIAVGTGKALRMGRDGDVDVVLVHAPDDEREFVSAGHGVYRRDVMYNHFVLVGPKGDPAKAADVSDVLQALRRIADGGWAFVSRGDDSGTHKKERSLWRALSIEPAGEWYMESGQGQGKTLFLANEKGAYALADKGTWLALRDKLAYLEICFEDGENLRNPYGIIAVNPDRYPNVNFEGAKSLIDWITSQAGQAAIAGYRIQGEALFHPYARAATE